MEMVSSLLLVHKPGGVTSFSSLSPVKRYVNRKTGHAGTLDKFAEGLMIVLTGNYTKLNPLFTSFDKSYTARIEFGKETTTLDPEGEVIATGAIPALPDIECVLREQFTGEIDQVPPIYSAVHVNGKRAHKLARSGKEVSLEARRVTIQSISALSYEEGILTLEVSCSKGTYIRSLARDIAHALSTHAYVKELRRDRIGPYHLSEAVDTESPEILRAHAEGSLMRLRKIPHIGSITLDTPAIERLSHGWRAAPEEYLTSEISPETTYAIVSEQNGKAFSIAQVDVQGRMVKNFLLGQER